jgi:hypothetical protein
LYNKEKTKEIIVWQRQKQFFSAQNAEMKHQNGKVSARPAVLGIP